jgi:hypothetical protein
MQNTLMLTVRILLCQYLTHLCLIWGFINLHDPNQTQEVLALPNKYFGIYPLKLKSPNYIKIRKKNHI